MTSLRRTKIIATLGPATADPIILEKLILAGVDLVRLNFSHGSHDDHRRRFELVKEISAKHKKEIGVIGDLQGPKIRIARFQNSQIVLTKNQTFILDADLASDAGDENRVGIDYKQLPQDVVAGDKILLDDGRIVLVVQAIQGNQIICVVEVGGQLSNHKGLNKLGGGLSAESLTEKDKKDLIFALSLPVDYLAVSFPRSAQDILEAKKLIAEQKGTVGVIAKIERIEAVKAIKEILTVSEAVMVARGDLGVEIGDAELPAVQKDIINYARAADKSVITATQMMESMIHNAIPTRAEVFDVANAVLDGTDAVMLSGETATGEHPDLVVSAMARICLGAEKQPQSRVSKHRLECAFNRVDEAIAMATMYTANHMNIRGIIALTESGSTPLWMSRIRSGIPIFALCRHPEVRRRMMLYRGVYPIEFDVTHYDRNTVYSGAVKALASRKLLSAEDFVILTKGDLMGVHGGANTMKILQVGKIV